MGYRKSGRAVEWTKWVSQNRDALTEAGVPDFVLADQFRWWRFLEHGYDGETGWSAAMLRPSQIAGLRALVEQAFGSDATKHLPPLADKSS